jgi:hypothetical protein
MVPNTAEMRGFCAVLRAPECPIACFRAVFLHFSLLPLQNRETEPIAIRAETPAWGWSECRPETAHIVWLETDWAL